jgi:hypothetical protein
MSTATAGAWQQIMYDPDTGGPAAFAVLRIYLAGSDTLANVWSDRAGSVAIAQPIPATIYGVLPQYFVPGDVALDYKPQTSDGRTIKQGLNVVYGNGTGGGAGSSDHKFGLTALDASPGYFDDKVVDTESVQWQDESATTKGASVNTSWLGSWLIENYAIPAQDHKVLTDATAGDVPGYLVAKFVDADGNPLLVNGAHQLVLPFARLDGAEFTGSIIVDGQLQSLGNTSLAAGPGATLLVSGPATMGIAAISDLKLPLLTPGDWLALDGAGNVVAVTPPSSDHKVLYDVSDAIPGFLGVKVQAGSGIQINMTTDGTNGKVMHLNVNPNYSPPNQNVTRAKAISLPYSPFGTTPESILNTSGVVITGPGLFIPSIANGLITGDQFMFDIFLDALANANCIAEFYLNGVLVPSSSLHLGAGDSRISYLVNYLGAGPGFVDLIGNAVSTNNSVSTQASIGVLAPAMDPTIDNVVDVMVRTSTGTTACGSCVWNFRKL